MKLIITALIFAAVAFAQVGPRPSDLPRVVEIDPGLIPATSTAVATSTTWVTMITLTNTSDAAVSCTVSDRQSTPRALVGPDIVVAAKSTWILNYSEGRKMPSGVTWACSSGTSVIGYLVGRQQ